MKLFTDHFFQIGASHLTSGKPCQDYAISETFEESAVAIVSDGCSSGRHTDVGSRVTALTMKTVIREYALLTRMVIEENADLEIRQKHRASIAASAQVLGLQKEDMLATCMYAYATPLGAMINITGDGVTALKYNDGRIIISRFDWKENMPFYPIYLDCDIELFIKAHHSSMHETRLTEERISLDISGNIISKEVYDHSLQTGIRGVTFNILAENLAYDLEYIVLFSDGVTQIDNQDWIESVKSFLSFKNTKGEFAKRRMIRGIKDVQKIGKGPMDDLAYAVIRIDESLDKEE